MRPGTSNLESKQNAKKVVTEDYFRVMKENKEINKKMKQLNLGGGNSVTNLEGFE